MKKLILLIALVQISVCMAQKKLFVSSEFISKKTFTVGIEGPAVDTFGNLYAVNFKQEGTIGIVTQDGHAKGHARMFVKLPEGSIGNAIQFHSDGSLLVADYVKHQILKVNAKTKAITVFAANNAMNQPNDLAAFTSDVFLASDPSWKDNTGKIWKIEQGKATLLEDKMGTTNGIVVSPDKKKLYVNESVQRNVWVYDLDDLGHISNKKLLIQFPDFGLDGMKCDAEGNIFIARYGKGVIAVLSPAGKLIREIKLRGQKPTNLAFSKNGEFIYVTMQDNGSIEKIKVK